MRVNTLKHSVNRPASPSVTGGGDGGGSVGDVRRRVALPIHRSAAAARLLSSVHAVMLLLVDPFSLTAVPLPHGCVCVRISLCYCSDGGGGGLKRVIWLTSNHNKQ